MKFPSFITIPNLTPYPISPIRGTKGGLFLLLLLLLFASCSDKDEVLTAFSLDKAELAIGADGGSESLTVTATTSWTASSDAAWLTLTPANGIGSQQCTLLIDSTLINDVRTAHIRFVADGCSSQTLTVTQTGYGNIIRAEQTELAIKASQRTKEDRHFDLTVTTNVAFDINIATDDTKAWLTSQTTEINLDESARPRKTTLRFNWTNNTVPEERTATITFTPKDPSLTLATPATVVVTQAAAQRIEDNREGDSLAIVAIAEALELYTMWDTNENMKNWSSVRLWEKNDEGLPCPEAIGRVRDAQFFLANTSDPIPTEVKYLKYVESLSFFSNVNSFIKDIEVGTEICGLKHLRSLEIFAWGISDFPEEFTQLGGTLECLKIGGNNFSDIPSVLTKENFPKLRILELHANRRWTLSDLRNAGNSRFEGGIGLYFHTDVNDALRRLLLWDTLEELVLSYNYIEGQVPDFKVGEDGVEAWSQKDVDAWGGDTIQWLADERIPKILPKAKRLCLNLNFFTGNMPRWLLYHPHLLDWTPDQLIFNQMEYGINSEGKSVHFSNEPPNFEYYYKAFPKYRNKYEIKEERED